MCGIAGILNIDSKFSSGHLQSIVKRMARRLSHRGPDDEGIWVSQDGQCILAHRRLSIIDLSRKAAQPMLTGDSRYALVYNGELYNYESLKEILKNSGEDFHTSSDTEVFLKGLARNGTEFFTYVDSMFALALYDSARKELTLGRDHFGEKPLYYTFQNGVFAFSSELNVLTELPDFDASITTEAISSYLSFQVVPAPGTIYRSCRKLPAGSYLRAGENGISDPTHFYEFIVGSEQHSGKEKTPDLDEQADALEELLLTALRRRLISDVPLGAFLSGGIDSSTVVALASQRLGRNLKTFSIGYENTADTEHEQAKQIARHLSIDNQTELLTPELVNYGVSLAARMDEPIVDSSCIPTFLVSRLAKQTVKVALTGDGGDEMFGGYNRYFHRVREAKGKEHLIRNREWHVGRAYYSEGMILHHDREALHLFGHVPKAWSDMLLSLRRRIDLDPRPLIHRFREMDVRYYLPVVLTKVDRMSMLNGLECRTPFLNADVAHFAAGLPEDQIHDGDRGKLVLRRLAERYIPREWLDKPKRGFGIPGRDDWTRKHVIPIVTDLLRQDDCHIVLWTGRERLDRYISERLPNRTLPEIWGLLVLENWLRANPFTPVSTIG